MKMNQWRSQAAPLAPDLFHVASAMHNLDLFQVLLSVLRKISNQNRENTNAKSYAE